MSQEVAIRAGTLLAPQLDYILLDGSSSMRGKWWDTLGALDGYMNVLRSENIASHGILHVFCSQELVSIQRDGVIGDWKTFAEDPAGAHWGMTPLYDAINYMGREFRRLNPVRATAVVVTDGEEVGSRHTTVDQAAAILNWMRAKGWQVVFLGANFNNEKQAKLLGVSERNTIGVRQQKLIEAGKELGAKRARHARTGDDIAFTDEEKTNFGGYLSHG
jgi:hypothetical protein